MKKGCGESYMSAQRTTLAGRRANKCSLDYDNDDDDVLGAYYISHLSSGAPIVITKDEGSDESDPKLSQNILCKPIKNID